MICATVPPLDLVEGKTDRHAAVIKHRRRRRGMSRSAATVGQDCSSRPAAAAFLAAFGRAGFAECPRRSAMARSDLVLMSSVVTPRPRSMRGTRPSSRSLKSMPRGGRAMRTRRPSPLPAPCAIARRRLAGFVAIGEHDHVADVVRQIESPKPRCRKRRPCRVAGRLHGGEAGLDALADHQHVAGSAQAARHRRGMDRASSSPARPAPCRCHRGRETCGECAIGLPSAPRVTSATIAGQTPPEGCFRPAWKRIEGGAGMVERARSRDRFRPAFPRPVASPPDGERRLRAPHARRRRSRAVACDRACARIGSAVARPPSQAPRARSAAITSR